MPKKRKYFCWFYIPLKAKFIQMVNQNWPYVPIQGLTMLLGLFTFMILLLS